MPRDIRFVSSHFFIEPAAGERAGLFIFLYGEVRKLPLSALTFVIEKRLFNWQTVEFTNCCFHVLSLRPMVIL